MVRASIACLGLMGLLLSSGCSGKTERGMGGEAPAHKPATDPATAMDPSPATAETDARRHLLLVVELELASQTAKIKKTRPVELPLPRRRGPAQQGPWQVDVLDAAGKVLYSAPLADGSTIRGEFVDEQGKLSGARVQKQVASVTLRLPLLKDAVSVRVSSLTRGGTATELGRVAYPTVQP